MSTHHLLDPELAGLPDLIPPVRFTAEMLPEFRRQRNEAIVMGDAEGAGVSRREVRIPVSDGTETRGLLYEPEGAEGARPGYLHVHGGGYIVGAPEGSDIMNLLVARHLGAVVLSVAYRLAPEHAIPAPLEDCYAGLAWLHGHAEALSVDPSRIAVGGESAGGGLAAALAILARDRGEYGICHQHLTYPMLDDRTGTAEAPGDPLVGEFVWTRESNRFGWQSYLGDAPRAAPQVPARLDDLAGLPPTWMFTAMLDLFRDENLEYARKLMAAGVPTDVEVFAGACHGFQLLPGTEIGERYRASHLAALKRGLR